MTRIFRHALIVIFGLLTWSPAKAQVAEILGIISFVRSLGGGGSDDSWLSKEFTAIHLKLDAILKNQERILEAIALISEQISNLEKKLLNEMRDLPYREVQRKLVASQARLRTLSGSLDAVKELPEDRKKAIVLALRDEIVGLRNSLPPLLEDLVGISASYNRIKYPFLATVSSTMLDLIIQMQLLESYVGLAGGPPLNDADKAKYLVHYRSVVSSIEPFLNQNTIAGVERELVLSFLNTQVPASEGVQTCLYMASVTPATLLQSQGQSDTVTKRCFYRAMFMSINNCSRRKETIYEAKFSLSPVEQFNFEKYESAPDKYLVTTQQNPRSGLRLYMRAFSATEDTAVAEAIAGGRIDSRHGELCNTFDRLETVVSGDATAANWCISEQSNCPWEIQVNFNTWVPSYRDVTSSRALEIYALQESRILLQRTLDRAIARSKLVFQ